MADAHQELAFPAAQILQFTCHVVEGQADLRQLVAAVGRSPCLEVTLGVRARRLRNARQPAAKIAAERQGEHHCQPCADQQCENQRPRNHPSNNERVEAPDGYQHANGGIVTRGCKGYGAYRGKNAVTVDGDGLHLPIHASDRDERQQNRIVDQVDESAAIRDESRFHEVVASDAPDFLQRPLHAQYRRTFDRRAHAAQLLLNQPGRHLGLPEQLILGRLARLATNCSCAQQPGNECHRCYGKSAPHDALTQAHGSSRYPTPHTVSIGIPGSFLRSWRICTSTVRVSPK